MKYLKFLHVLKFNSFGSVEFISLENIVFVYIECHHLKKQVPTFPATKWGPTVTASFANL